MSEVLVVGELSGGRVTKPTAELLTLANRLGAPVAVLFDSVAATESAAAELGAYGATAALVVSDPAVNEFLVAPKAAALAQLAAAREPVAVLISSSAEGKEVAGQLAVKLESGLITDAVDLAADGTTTQSVFAGNWTVAAGVSQGPAVISVKPNAVTPQLVAGAAAPVTEVEVEIPETARGARIVASEPRAVSGRPQLNEAAVVISGGRGTGGEFGSVEALADALGGAVGASRAAVDSGWYPHAYQVGQTGVTVSPQLYVAAGISGAIQHRAGMQTAKAIVAINKDPEAPIFDIAELGIVGDLHTVLPAAIELIKQRQA